MNAQVCDRRRPSVNDGHRFVVNRVFRISSRPYVLAIGLLEEGVIESGTACQLITPYGETFPGTIEHLELHSAPGQQTISMSGPASKHIVEGSIVTAAPIRDQAS